MIVTAEGLKVSLPVAVTVPAAPVVGVDGPPVQPMGSEAKKPQMEKNKSEIILFMGPRLKNLILTDLN